MIIKTNKDMAMTFASASATAAKNKLQSARAKSKKNDLLENLLSAMAQSEEIHARRALMHLRGKIKETEKHIEDLIQYKYDLHTQYYPKMSKDASEAGKKSASELYYHLAKVAKIHLDLLKAFTKKELDVSSTFYVCSVCGHIALNSIPERCPVCNAVPKRFKTL